MQTRPGHSPMTFSIQMRAGKLAFWKLIESMRPKMVQHRLDNTQNTGLTPGMNLKAAMIDLDYDFKYV